MMKKLVAISCMILTMLSLSAIGSSYGKEYVVTFKNLTVGQPIAPFLFAVHKRGFHLFELGEPASAGLAYQAEDGSPSLLMSELENQKGICEVITNGAVVMPGETTELSVPVRCRGKSFSLTAMLTRTNDAFVAIRDARLPKAKGATKTYPLFVYDAGSEANTESCSHIPAPPCSSPNQRVTDGAEGYVHPHSGLRFDGDLDSKRDRFASVAAVVEVKRLH